MNEKPFDELTRMIDRYAELKAERGAAGVDELVTAARETLEKTIASLRALPEGAALTEREPDDLAQIRAARPAGRTTLAAPGADLYREKLAGALLSRSAGCLLGAPVEGMSVSEMETWAREIGDQFPPTDYWSAVTQPEVVRYFRTRKGRYARGKLDGILVDDDLQYTLLGLLVLEAYGPDFTTADVGAAWLRYLPYACTAEDIALGNLRRGEPAETAGASGGATPTDALCFASTQDSEPWPETLDNPYQEWIGADIRCDPWGYVCPGDPERAATMAYQDAYLSHRRNGVYGAMYFAAAISAAFCVDDPVSALHIGLEQIPEHCRLAEAIRWALDIAPSIRSYRDANAAVAERFPGMHAVHTINNACLTVWGLTIGGTNVTRVLGETVAMAYDNDCTAATAGSIVGAVVGEGGVPEHWTRPFANRFCSYLTGVPELPLDELIDRFIAQRVNE